MGDGVPFTALFPDFEDYFEMGRRLAAEPAQEKLRRKLLRFDKGG